jgi:LPXTG-site transpeptidase (sortase) family protein
MRPPYRLVWLLWAALFLIGCSPQAAFLAPPAVAVTRAAPTRTAIPVLQPPVSASPTPDPSSYPGLLGLAAQAYGPRLIASVEIPAIDVDTPVTAVGWMVKDGSAADAQIEWDSPGPLAGWVITSGLPGDGANIVLYGHNNLYASIFRDLGSLKAGDRVLLKTGESDWQYKVSQVIFLRAAFVDTDTLKSYMKYLQPGTKEQLTLISCWPPVSNTHRIVVLAEPDR